MSSLETQSDSSQAFAKTAASGAQVQASFKGPWAQGSDGPTAAPRAV